MITEIVRQGVRRILETQNDWEICGEAANGQEALRLSQQLKPDAIVMDITMPVLDGLEATKQITKTNPHSRVLILTTHERRGLLGAAQSSGAKGVLAESRAASDLTSALRAILAGKTYFDWPVSLVFSLEMPSFHSRILDSAFFPTALIRA